MEQEKLTYNEIEKFLISKINNDSKIIDCFFMRVPQFIDVMFLDVGIAFKGLSKQEQLKEVYDCFISMINITLNGRSIKYKSIKTDIIKLLPLGKLKNEVDSLSQGNYKEFTKEQWMKIWVYKIIIDAVKSTINITIRSYTPKTRPSMEQWSKAMSERQAKLPVFDYRSDIEDYFKTVISTRPDISTIRTIDKLKGKVEKMAEKEGAKAELINKSHNLISKREEIILSIVSEIDFYQHWINLNKPTIKDTLILCQWEHEKDYHLFLEKLLFIELLERKYLNIICPDGDKKILKAIKDRKKHDEKVKKATRKEVNDWVIRHFTERITDDELKSLIINIDEVFEKKEETYPTPINKVMELDVNDIMTAFWVIWYLYRKHSNSDVPRELVAGYIKKQFPLIFEGKKVANINSHLSDDDGTIIKIPKVGFKDSISRKKKHTRDY